MQKNEINPNQLNMFENTTHGEIPYNQYSFYGSNYDDKKDKHRLNTKLFKVFSIIKNWGEFTNQELYKVTNPLGINDDTASRCVRRIGELKYMGYFIFKNENKTPVTFRCVKF